MQAQHRPIGVTGNPLGRSARRMAKPGHLQKVTRRDSVLSTVAEPLSAGGPALQGFSTMSSVEEAFRRLTIGDPDFVAALDERDRGQRQLPRLDARTEALMRIAALVAV